MIPVGQLPMMSTFHGDIERHVSPDYVDLFEGAGGWATAARRLGLLGYGVEIDPAACKTLEACGYAHFNGSVDDPRIQGDPKIARVAGLIASPPCQTFSAAGKGSGRAEMDKVLAALRSWAWNAEDFADPRTALVLEPARWILQRLVVERPFEWVAMEQVPTCLPIWNAYAEMLEALGYFTAVGVLSAEQYGVPQTRKRVILVAHRERPVSLPTPTHSKYYNRDPKRLDEGIPKWISMAEALGWPEDVEVHSNYNTGGVIGNKGVRTGDQPAAAVTSKISRNKIYLRMDRQAEAVRYARPVDSPAATIKAGHSTAERAWMVDGEEWRQVTVAEAGVLQSFPGDYRWRGTKTQQYTQAGNAIPVLLAEAVLREVAL